MRVLVVPKWYPSRARPVFGSFCREHAVALAREHDVVVLASEAVRRPSFLLYRLSRPAGEPVTTLWVRYRRPRIRPLGVLFQLMGMLHAVLALRRRGWRADIVHAHVYSAALPALALARLGRVPLVITEHYTGFQRGLVTGVDRLVARAAFRGAALVGAVSGDLERRLREVQPRARTRVVGNVVDTSVFHPGRDGSGRAPADGPLRLLSVGALAAKKGHRDLLEALSRLAQAAPARFGAPLELHVVGDGELREDLRREAEALGVDSMVRFHGALPKEAVAAAMREADLFVLPSHYENQPCVLIEAMASGLPAVATEVGGVAELLAGRGFLCPARDPRALAERLAQAIEALPAVDRGALRAEAEARFSQAAFVAAWTAIYEELKGRRPNPPEPAASTPGTIGGEGALGLGPGGVRAVAQEAPRLLDRLATVIRGRDQA